MRRNTPTHMQTQRPVQPHPCQVPKHSVKSDLPVQDDNKKTLQLKSAGTIKIKTKETITLDSQHPET